MLHNLRKLFSPHGITPPATGAPTIALAEVLRHNWLELWYQPKIDLRSKRLAGAEALARARHPQFGLLGPGAFLPGAGEADMRALTEQVIITALRDWSDFAEDGMSVLISVNTPVSALIKLPIANIIRKHRPKSSSWPGLILEVTEDEIMQDIAKANEVAEALRACNCHFALDDFGAGYSSLGRLQQLPFSELKIDRSYVSNCHTDRINAGLCEIIVELGQRFGLKTVAEGIENVYEYHKLQGLGCDIGQGYLFSKPLSKDAFIDTALKRLVTRHDDTDGRALGLHTGA